MKWVYAALAALAVMSASALEKNFSWTAPTTNTDGSPLAAAQIAGYTLTCGALEVPINGPVTSFRRDFGPGSYECTLRTRATNGEVSEPSNAVSFIVPQPVPGAPAGFSVD
jgi:hypothetical protein